MLGPATRKRSGFPTTVAAVVALLAAGAGGAIWYLNQYRGEPASAQGATVEAKSYLKHLALSEVELKATDSYMANALVEILGKVTNNGDRTVRLVELNCVFYDPYNQVVLRERAGIVRPKTGSLAPGETKPFRMAFDSLPPSWNQGMPQLVVARIEFE
jgi:archaellum component FlaF (FlaF/FlaG flagellin family)